MLPPSSWIYDHDYCFRDFDMRTKAESGFIHFLHTTNLQYTTLEKNAEYIYKKGLIID